MGFAHKIGRQLDSWQNYFQTQAHQESLYYCGMTCVVNNVNFLLLRFTNVADLNYRDLPLLL